MRFTINFLINFILILIFTLGFVIFIFWRFGIFKKEADLSKVEEIKAKINLVNTYPYQDLARYFQTLPMTKIEIPEIKPEEIGRPGLF